ncbi:hypothetical protein CLOM_g1233 [Closterium sp. NIES-68]|nr:hypothetical protein CLOM_g1233 [Closterium sp. NIES-68]GJP67231.1 hypothetical protein CLOP_g24076 [Closterium sp. NIES-67]
MTTAGGTGSVRIGTSEAPRVPEIMSAWQYSKHGGGADALSLNSNVPVPKLAKGEVLVRVRAASINPGDWKVQSGLLPFLPLRFPATAGYDLAGKVVGAGPGVTKYTVGDAVFGRAPFFKMGALAQYALLDQDGSAHKPPSLSFETAAALPSAGLTALQAVRDYAGLPLPVAPHSREGSGDSTTTIKSSSSRCSTRVLVANASGGVGHLAVQLAKAAGAHVTATVGARNLAFARNLGADEVLDYNSAEGKQLFPSPSPSPVTSLSAPTAVQNASAVPPPINGLYDAVIGCAFNSPAVSAVDRVLRPEGKWVHVSPALSEFALGLWRRFALRPKKIFCVMVENRGADLEVLGRMVGEGKVKVVVESSVPFEEAREAWRKSMEGHVTGKLVVRME